MILADNKRIVIVGATSAIAEQCARLWLDEATVDLTLVVRDVGKGERVADDLRVRSPQSLIRVLAADFIAPQAIRKLVDGIAAAAAVDIVLIAHGSLPDQSACQADLTACHEALTVNALSPVLFAEAFAGHMAKAGRGSLAIIGSVAGDRGRKSNYVYGASKGLLSRYAQGLQHRFAGTAVKVILIKPGPTRTPMTAHLQQKGGSFASPESVAAMIVEGVTRSRPVVYAPAKWALIMQIIRHLPNVIFNRMNV